ncbi:TPA: restriction endonuclease subunit S [Vibrio parahaemolyticus]|nr:restriction endonuclease subunit S [Vibrio parahaemolyticus]HCH2684386.1 restriction endonuclease subunit S [Vibrio parahaemolyticus]HCH4160353.1 restriction endonuclease subunit S [Vibrio parahaemolyticus]
MKSDKPLFPESWQSKIAADCFLQISTTHKKVKTKDCNETGAYPVIDQGQASVAGYIDDPSKVIEVESPLCIFGDHTRAVKWVDSSFVPGADGTKVLQPLTFLFPRFAYQQLRNMDIPDKGYSRHFKYFKELWFGIPPMAEQKVIAEKLDTLLAQVEATKARLESTLETLKQFRQSVLAAAVSGRLTEDWRDTEVSNHLSFNSLKALESLKNKLIKDKLVKKDLLFQLGEQQFSVPADWHFVKLKSLATKITDGEHKTPKRETTGRWLLSARNVRDGYISLDDVDYVGEEEYEKLRKRCDPQEGDVLISCSGSVGRVSLVDKNDSYVMVRSAALIKTIDGHIHNRYLEYVLRSPMLQKLIEESSKSTAQANLFLGPIKELDIPLPSIAEQQEIVRRVDRLFTGADDTEQQVKQALERINNLTQSILAKAFRGELTEQWRKENPDLISGENSAEALLKKIKAERAAAKPKRKARTTSA